MTPGQKAKQLYNKFLQYVPAEEVLEHEFAKRCAHIAVDEILETLNKDIRDVDVRGNVLLDLIEYWNQVKTNINQ